LTTLTEFVRGNPSLLADATAKDLDDLKLPDNVQELTKMRRVDANIYRSIREKYDIKEEHLQVLNSHIVRNYSAFLDKERSAIHVLKLIDFCINMYLHNMGANKLDWSR
jgi:hypothetical protein